MIGLLMSVTRIIGIFIAVAFAAMLLFVVAITTVFKPTLFDLYVRNLDTWAENGGHISSLQTDVVDNCAKLILSQAGPRGALSLAIFDRDELDFRVDVCVKIAVNRIHKQPEFENPATVSMICNSQLEIFRMYREGNRLTVPR